VVFGFVCALLIAMLTGAERSYEEYQEYQNDLMEQSVSGSANKIQILLDGLRTSLQMFVSDRVELLRELERNPNDDDAYQSILSPLANHFPDYYAFTLANSKGEVLYDDFGEKIGDLCLQDIEAFAKGNRSEQIYVHPGPGKYHFDVMVPWRMSDNSKGVFFVSFKPERVVQLLRDSQIPGHNLLLVRKDTPDLIEITSKGVREILADNNRLSSNELGRISVSTSIPTTRWTLVDVPEIDLFTNRSGELTNQLILAIGTLLLVTIFLWTWIRREEKQRYIAEIALRDSNNLLENRVEERTFELAEINRFLQHEIEERRKAEERFEFLAHHDMLTQLPNRTLLLDRLDHALSHAQRHGKLLAVLFLDIDHFKRINDSLGHGAGDQLLVKMVERLDRVLRQEDTLARFGGDEFIIVLNDFENPAHVEGVAEKLLKEFEQPFLIEQAQLFVTPSIGISVYPDDGTHKDKLLRNADMAMYRAKERGRNAYQFFTSDMTRYAFRRHTLETRLRNAVKTRGFEVYYQPKINLNNGRVNGVEALIRWNDVELGYVNPEEFIPVLEETGLIVEVGEWVISQACQCLKKRVLNGEETITVAVNVSVRQFYDHELVNKVVSALERADLSPSCLELEVTESLLLQNVDSASDTLKTFHDMGINVAIDDFGTGYSSLSYLRSFPIDTVKIDSSFVKELSFSRDNAEIVRAIIAMAHSLNLKCVAEGVETDEQRAFLEAEQCDEAQGFYFSQALPDAKLSLWEMRHNERAAVLH